MHGLTNPKLMFILKVSLASKTNSKSCQHTVSVCLSIAVQYVFEFTSKAFKTIERNTLISHASQYQYTLHRHYIACLYSPVHHSILLCYVKAQKFTPFLCRCKYVCDCSINLNVKLFLMTRYSRIQLHRQRHIQEERNDQQYYNHIRNGSDLWRV
jgi:hypothetical protein